MVMRKEQELPAVSVLASVPGSSSTTGRKFVRTAGAARLNTGCWSRRIMDNTLWVKYLTGKQFLFSLFILNVRFKI